MKKKMMNFSMCRQNQIIVNYFNMLALYSLNFSSQITSIIVLLHIVRKAS